MRTHVRTASSSSLPSRSSSGRPSPAPSDASAGAAVRRAAARHASGRSRRATTPIRAKGSGRSRSGTAWRGRRSFRVRCSSCRSAARAAVDSRRGSRRDLPRHGRLDADRTPLALGDPRPTRRRAAPVRLRRGDSDSSCGRTSASSTSRTSFLTHFHADHFLGLPDAEDLCAPRARAAARAARTARARRPAPLAGRDHRPPHLRGRRRRGRRRRRAPSRRLRAGTFAVRHGREALGYALVEAERPGRFDVATPMRSEPAWARARHPAGGKLVTLADGRVVMPQQVLGEARPGRKLVLTGDTAPPTASWKPRSGPTCSSTRPRSARTRRSGLGRPTPTPLDAARVALDAGVRLLALTHLSSRYGGGDVEQEARTVFLDTSSRATST